MSLPDLSTTGTDVTVIRWLVQVGDTVRRGQPLLELETDKAVMELESIASGTVKSFKVQPGDAVAKGEVIAVLEVGDRSKDRPAIAKETPDKRTSLFARNRAQRRSEEAVTQDTSEITPNQRIVGRRMHQSKQTVPHFYLQTSANAEPMVERRKVCKPDQILWDAFFVFAAGRALRAYEQMSYRFENDQFVRSGADTIGVAIDVSGDLYVVPIQTASTKSIEQISQELSVIIEQLHSGDSQARRMQQCNMTISNLGGAKVESFVAVINPPESCVLAIGKVGPIAVVRDGEVAVENRVNLTLSVDHRVANGKYAADFLNAIVNELENL